MWVTRDRGAHVLLVREVPAGLTAMQALDRVADIETTYGGRYVQSINGIDGSLSAQSDWFYFMNGIEGDRSAAEVPASMPATSNGGTTARGRDRCGSRSSWAPFPSRFAHGVTVNSRRRPGGA